MLSKDGLDIKQTGENDVRCEIDKVHHVQGPGGEGTHHQRFKMEFFGERAYFH